MTSASNDVTPQDVRDAAARLVGGIVRTPCIHSLALSRLTGAEVWTKNEYEQRTGSFKERGARNALLQIPVADRARGVVAASAGNHALALAWHGRELGIPVTVVMPLTAPLVKQARCRELGARVLLEGQNIAEAKVRADAFVVSDRMIYVHGFNDAAIIAGAGTVALEVLEDLPDVDAIIVPIGGGGLIAGVALVAKDARKSIEIIGVEPARCASFLAAAGQQQQVRRSRMDLRCQKLARVHSRSLDRWSIAWSRSTNKRFPLRFFGLLNTRVVLSRAQAQHHSQRSLRINCNTLRASASCCCSAVATSIHSYSVA